MDLKTHDLIAALLPLLLAQLTPRQEAAPAAPSPTVGNTPGGMPMQPYAGPTVAVTPTGARATGETRYWPVPLAGENWFGYLVRMTSITRPDGLPYVPAQYRAQVSNVLLGGGPTRPADYAWHADCFAYPEEWRTEAQWQQAERDLAGWTDWNARMQQRGSDAPGTGGTL